MTEVIYSIELDTLDTTGLTMVKVKMGKTSNLESRLNNYQTGMLGEPKVLDVWYPNPDVGLSSVENGVLDIAQQYSYNRNGEAFVFLQNGYQEFSETIDKLLEATTREKIRDASPDERETTTDDYTGEVPAVVRLHGKTYEVSSWTECVVTVAEWVLSQAESGEPLKQVSGRTRDYIVEQGEESQHVSPKQIDNSELYIETNLSANNAMQVNKKMLRAYDYDLAEFDVLTE
jgi:hypothetical protein